MTIANEMKNTALNGICPYFTMFPLTFPYNILSYEASEGEWVLDPFCGRGTTNYACRILGLPSIGIDSNPVAVAISEAKLANTTPQAILHAAQQILEEVPIPRDVPVGEFWDLAYHQDVLLILCRFREGLLKDCLSDARKALRTIIMGALHGPRPKIHASYFSNQSQRTYAPKPSYAVNFWKSRNLMPQLVNVLDIIEERARRYYSQESTPLAGRIIYGDSREKWVYSQVPAESKVGWVITSPPYYGMRTYIPDQWLRLWFVGGHPNVDYSSEEQLSHSSQSAFISQLHVVWKNIHAISVPGARLVIRFGAINDRKVDSISLLRQSLKDSGWEIKKIETAGVASKGRRQALHFSHPQKGAIEEHDVWGVRTG